MKKILILTLILASFQVNATLFNRGNGLIYDSVQDLTWVQDPLAAVNFAKHTSQGGNGSLFSTTLSPDGRNNFGDSAIISNIRGLNYKGYSDWRRPDGAAPLGTIASPADIIAAVNSFDNELYNLFNTAGNDLSMFNLPVGGWVFWSSHLQLADPANGIFSNNGVFQFNTATGVNTLVNRQFVLSSEWAVRSGDVSNVPVPGAILLFASGLLTLFVRRKTV